MYLHVTRTTCNLISDSAYHHQLIPYTYVPTYSKMFQVLGDLQCFLHLLHKISHNFSIAIFDNPSIQPGPPVVNAPNSAKQANISRRFLWIAQPPRIMSKRILHSARNNLYYFINI